MGVVVYGYSLVKGTYTFYLYEKDVGTSSWTTSWTTSDPKEVRGCLRAYSTQECLETLRESLEMVGEQGCVLVRTPKKEVKRCLI